MSVFVYGLNSAVRGVSRSTRGRVLSKLGASSRGHLERVSTGRARRERLDKDVGRWVRRERGGTLDKGEEREKVYRARRTRTKQPPSDGFEIG